MLWRKKQVFEPWKKSIAFQLLVFMNETGQLLDSEDSSPVTKQFKDKLLYFKTFETTQGGSLKNM